MSTKPTSFWRAIFGMPAAPTKKREELPWPDVSYTFMDKWKARCVLDGHQWEEKWNLNSGFYHHGALGRRGHLCKRCALVHFPESNQQYYNEQVPEWMKNDPALHIPNDVSPAP